MHYAGGENEFEKNFPGGKGVLSLSAQFSNGNKYLKGEFELKCLPFNVKTLPAALFREIVWGMFKDYNFSCLR